MHSLSSKYQTHVIDKCQCNKTAAWKWCNKREKHWEHSGRCPQPLRLTCNYSNSHTLSSPLCTSTNVTAALTLQCTQTAAQLQLIDLTQWQTAISFLYLQILHVHTPSELSQDLPNDFTSHTDFHITCSSIHPTLGYWNQQQCSKFTKNTQMC